MRLPLPARLAPPLAICELTMFQQMPAATRHFPARRFDLPRCLCRLVSHFGELMFGWTTALHIAWRYGQPVRDAATEMK
jgi:hypothetical protein